MILHPFKTRHSFLSCILLLILFPSILLAVDLKTEKKDQPFMGQHENIKWIKHTRLFGVNDAVFGQIDVGKIDLDGDNKDETIKARWAVGTSNNPLTIELYMDKMKFDTIYPHKFGIQSNYKIDDIDNDGKLEIIIWSGLWDPRLPGEAGISEKKYEGQSFPHRYVVVTYKLIRNKYYLWDTYTTKKKYAPYPKKQPKK